MALQADGTLYPRAHELIEQADGQILMTIHRCTRSMLSYIALAFITATFVSLLRLYMPGVGLLSWLYIVPALFLLEMLRLTVDDAYEFEEELVRKIDGKLSFKYRVPMVSYSDIRGISIRQSIMGRILDYGDVVLGTAAETGSEMLIMGIRDPLDLAELIDELRVRLDPNEAELTIQESTAFGGEVEAQRRRVVGD